MPTFSTIPFDYLLEPRLRESYTRPLESNHYTSPPPPPPDKVDDEVVKRPPVGPRHIYISPALYTTPEPAPIPETYAESLSSTPYVVNLKRRGGGVVGDRKRNSVKDVPPAWKEEEKVKVVKDDYDEIKLSGEGGNGVGDVQGLEESKEEEEDDFIDSRCDRMSNGSGRQFDCRSFVSTQGDYFDAVEDFSSDNTIQSVESELFATKLSLLEEIERRKNAEEALSLMDSRWLKIRNILFEAGLASSNGLNSGGMMHCEDASIEELAQELVVTKFVVEEIEKGLARAEVELDADVILDSKDQDISWLRDRLQYYEAVTHEMSQGNQKIIDHARKQRHRKKTHKKLFWMCIGLSIFTGISVLAYSYLPDSRQHQESPTDSSDVN